MKVFPRTPARTLEAPPQHEGEEDGKKNDDQETPPPEAPTGEAPYGPLRAHVPQTPIDMDAERLEMDRTTGILRAEGNVHMTQTGRMALRADRAEYHATSQQIQASGHIRLTRRGDLFASERLLLDVTRQTGTLQDVQVNLRGPGGEATAKTVRFRHEGGGEEEGRDFFTLQDAEFSNCECAPGQTVSQLPWHLTSANVEVDRLENTVTARNIRLYAGRFPVFASPWWQHPLTPTRKSGFLHPLFRVSGNGFEVEVPYYWNLAANRDATLALRSLSRRGLMAKLQYRYLGQNFTGTVDTHGIYDTQEARYRGLTVVDHAHVLGDWRVTSHLEHSRTRDFINDFEQGLVENHSRRLESTVAMDRIWMRRHGYTSFQTGVRWYQDLEQNNDDLTVQNLPFAHLSDSRILWQEATPKATADPRGRRWRLDSDMRLDHFYQLVGDSSQRLDLAPTLHFQQPLYIGWASAALGLRETAYWIQGDPNQSELERANMLHREAAHLSLRLDGSLRKSYGHTYQHTLEPTLQYVLNATTDQSKLPNHDASLRTFTVTDIFARNLYSGVDRISDAQWIGYGLTSRLLAHDDANALWEQAVLTVGQRWAPEGNQDYQNGHAFSSVAASLEMDISRRLSFATTLGFNPYEKAVESTDTLVSMTFSQGPPQETTPQRWDGWVTLRHHLNNPEISGQQSVDPSDVTGLARENDREPVEDLSLNASLRLSESWTWTQKSDYSLAFDEFKSWRTGLTYEHPCWSLNITGGRDLATTTNKHGGGFIGFFVTLQGLGGVGI